MQPLTVVEGGVTFLDRENVDTDQIVPARFLQRVERAGYGECLLYDWRKNGEIDLQPNPVLVTGENFGCGSSREHAAWAIEDFGFRVVIAPSFGDIFAGNAAKVGLLPIRLQREACRSIVVAGTVSVDLPGQVVRAGGREWAFDIDADTKYRLTHGLDDIAITVAESSAAIDAFETAHDLLPRPVTTQL
ncbi:3-isopropylmalate dehydratase small subunit [Pseudonocardia broussonetiae]|uniref:3-isopropylmalate dehydratase small subunit n=1 Tax=Pseudonocardia broussonetiae TaxID=2736640 RepID=A0A6M6JNF9_9PSEU|nr:3-isopropylmalate dehydratase small subunit [Pseudonocardia broussonetiae]QJY48885.1 3-isopropylmalate dehydratase small subunit [Pseudonocardia broussonetiae]